MSVENEPFEHLRARVATLEGLLTGLLGAPDQSGSAIGSRRQMLKLAGAAALGAAGAATAAPSMAGATDGNAIIAGSSTSAELEVLTPQVCSPRVKFR